MAATGYTPISLYYSTTGSAAPTAANLVPGELAINITDGKLYYEDNLGVVQVIATKDAAAGSFSSITDSGNLTFTGTGNRITGDFSNATFSNRVAFQSSTTNGNTVLSFLPNGTATTSSVDLFNNSDPTNASRIRMYVTPTVMGLDANITGTGTYLPMTFYTNNAERMRIYTGGGVSIGNTTDPGNGALSVTGGINSTRIRPRATTTTSSATPTINTDNTDIFGLTAQAVDITSFTTNLSGTPTDGQKLQIYIVGTAARAITWGASFEASTVPLPTTTVSTNRLDVGFIWNAATSKWRCVATA